MLAQSMCNWLFSQGNKQPTDLNGDLIWIIDSLPMLYVMQMGVSWVIFRMHILTLFTYTFTLSVLYIGLFYGFFLFDAAVLFVLFFNSIIVKKGSSSNWKFHFSFKSEYDFEIQFVMLNHYFKLIYYAFVI